MTPLKRRFCVNCYVVVRFISCITKWILLTVLQKAYVNWYQKRVSLLPMGKCVNVNWSRHIGTTSATAIQASEPSDTRQSVRSRVPPPQSKTRAVRPSSSAMRDTAASSLLRASRAYAALAGRDYVSPDDIAALAVPVDVTDRESVSRAAGRVAAEWGQADLVFANAGVQLISAIDDLKVDDWQRQIDLNITGVMNTIAAFVPHLIENADAGRPADLMTTSSIAATRVLEKFSVYSGTKAYLSQLTRLLRVELGQKMVRVSTIEPGMVDTELPDHVTDPDASKLMADLIENIDVLSAADVAAIARAAGMTVEEPPHGSRELTLVVSP